MNDTELANFLRSKRTLTQEEVDERAAYKASDLPASVRWTGRQAHTTASPSAH